MKDIFMSPILYTVIGVLLNTIIIYVKNYKEAKAMQGTGTFKYNWKAFSVNAKFPPSVQNVVNLILLIATIVTYVMGGSKINDAIAVILIYVIVNIIRPIVGGIIFSKIALKNNKRRKVYFLLFCFL